AARRGWRRLTAESIRSCQSAQVLIFNLSDMLRKRRPGGTDADRSAEFVRHRRAGRREPTATRGEQERMQDDTGAVKTRDGLDARLLLELVKDPRATIAGLAQRLSIARNTAHARVTRLEAEA